MWCHDLGKRNKKYYSQDGEDGIIEFIFENIGTTNKFCVEFGAGLDGTTLSNTRHFLNNGWSGLMMDYNGDQINVQKEFITAENINELFEKHNVPIDFDLCSIDIDGNDYYIWKELKYRPRVVVIEFNGTIPINISKTIKYSPSHIYNNDDYYGASFLAFKKLGEAKGYRLVHQQNKTNLIFVLADLLPNTPIEVSFSHEQYHPHSILNKEWVEV